MSRRQAILAAVVSGALLAGSAEAIDFDLGGGYAVTSGEGWANDVNTTLIQGSYYFGGVSNSRSPYDLHPFLQAAPYVQVVYSMTEELLAAADVDVLDVNAEFFMADPVDGLSLRPHIYHTVTDVDLPFVDPVSVDTWGLDLGYYVLDELKLTLPAVLQGYLDGDDGDFIETDDSFKDLLIEYAVRAQGHNAFLTAALGWVTEPEFDVNELTLGGTYYASRELGVGLAFALNDYTDSGMELTAVGVEVSYWAEGMVRLAGQLTFYTEEWAFGEARTIGGALAVRF